VDTLAKYLTVYSETQSDTKHVLIARSTVSADIRDIIKPVCYQETSSISCSCIWDWDLIPVQNTSYLVDNNYIIETCIIVKRVVYINIVVGLKLDVKNEQKCLQHLGSAWRMCAILLDGLPTTFSHFYWFLACGFNRVTVFIYITHYNFIRFCYVLQDVYCQGMRSRS
jgi:hypothetical protein